MILKTPILLILLFRFVSSHRRRPQLCPILAINPELLEETWEIDPLDLFTPYKVDPGTETVGYNWSQTLCEEVSHFQFTPCSYMAFWLTIQ